MSNNVNEKVVVDKEDVVIDIDPKTGKTGQETQEERLANLFIKVTTSEYDIEKHSEDYRKLVGAYDIRSSVTGRNDILSKNLSSFKSNGKNCDDLTKDLQELANISDDFSNKLNGKKKLFGIIPINAKKTFNQLMDNFGTTEQLMTKVVDNLEGHKEVLENNNITIKQDIKGLKIAASIMREQNDLAKKVVAIINKKMMDNPELADNDKFTQKLFELNSKILGVDEQTIITENAVHTLGLQVESNTKFIISIERSTGVTKTALSLAVMVNKSLDDQIKANLALEGTNKMISNLMSSTSAKVKEYNDIAQKAATSTSLDKEDLKKSFRDITDTIASNMEFNRNKLETIKGEIRDFEDLLTKSKNIMEANIYTGEDDLDIIGG